MSYDDPNHTPHAKAEDSTATQIPSVCSGRVKKHPLDYATFAAVLVATGAAVAAAVYTNSQVQIAKDTSYSQLRPWVGVDVRLVGDLELKSDKYHLKLLYKITNHGDTPAREVFVLPQILLHTPGMDLDVQRDKLCDLGSRNPPYFAEGIDILFPKQTHDWVPFEFPIDQAAIEQSLEFYRKLFKADSMDSFTPMIIGCVTYRMTLDKEMHRTPFMLQVSRDDPDHFGNRQTIHARMGTVPLKSLIIEPMVHLKGIQPD